MIKPLTRLCLAAVLAVLASCGGQQPDRPPNIVLVTIDCLRMDKVGAYGHEGHLTPHMDALAARGAVFNRAWVSMATTFPSHSTMLTGRFANYHGVRWNGHRLPDEVPTITESLAVAGGYDTGAFVSYGAMLFRGGLERGFSSVSDDAPRPGEGAYIRPGDEVMAMAIDWLGGRSSERPFFLWTHLFEPHSPYELTPYAEQRLRDYDGPLRDGASTEYVIEERKSIVSSPEDLEALHTLYEGELQRADQYLGDLLASLEQRGLLDHSVVIVTGDHGEALGDRGGIGHGPLLWESLLAVPLIIADFRNGASRRVSEPVGLVDLAATMADLAGVPAPEGQQGRSLLPALAGLELEERTYFAEVRHVPNASGDAFDPGAVTAWSWPFKLEVSHDDYRLFDVQQNPEADEPLDPVTYGAVFEFLKSEVEEFRSGQLTSRAAKLSESDLEELRSLGYIQ